MSNYSNKQLLKAREDLLKIFNRLSSNELIRLYNIMVDLDLQGIVLSYCIEILTDRGFNILSLPRHVDID